MPASDDNLDWTLCLDSMVPNRKWRPTRLRNSMTFCSEYHSQLSTILETKTTVLITEYTSTHVHLLFNYRMAFTYIAGVNVRVLECLSHRYCSWFLKTRSMFSFIEHTLALTTADCNSSLSMAWPLGSPILPVAPPTYDIQHEQITRLHKLQRRQIHYKSRNGEAKMTPSSSPWGHLMLLFHLHLLWKKLMWET